MSHFNIRAKATTSQCEKCTLRPISAKTDELYEKKDDGQLVDQLQKLLKGKRYLIVIDDIWTKKAWDDVKLCFPKCNKRSRILLTNSKYGDG